MSEKEPNNNDKALNAVDIQRDIILARKKLAEEVAQPNLDIPQEKLKAAVQEGNKALSDYLLKRAKKIVDPMVLIPIDEGVRHFRLGTIGYDGFGLSPVQFRVIKKKLLGIGFPDIQSSESRVVNATWVRSVVLGGHKVSIQHFPSGGAVIETTETEEVHIDKPFLRDFKTLIENGTASSVMISHCSYDYNETNFPGIEAIKVKTPLHPTLSKVDFNTIPASLNPVLISYLREKMGFQGVIIADWYSMGAIIKFVDRLKINVPNGKASQEINEWEERQFKVFILAVLSGVSTITGMGINTFLQANWKDYKKKYPKDFAALESAMDNTISKNYEIYKEKNATKIDLRKLSFKEKILFFAIGIKQMRAFSSHGNAKKTTLKFLKVADEKFQSTDVWSRYGVMTLLQRQFIAEHIAGKKFANPPTTIEEEDVWFKNLMGNPEFRNIYDRIDWESPSIQKWFDEIADNNFQGK